MNAEKHECSLLKVVSDVGSTPTASTNYFSTHKELKTNKLSNAQAALRLFCVYICPASTSFALTERSRCHRPRSPKFFPHEIGLADLTEFRAGWSEIYPSSMTRSKVQEGLRGFLRYCHASNLIARVPILSAMPDQH
jgi:hypothetical protein